VGIGKALTIKSALPAALNAAEDDGLHALSLAGRQPCRGEGMVCTEMVRGRAKMQPAAYT
jgi:hypothetical protein